MSISLFKLFFICSSHLLSLALAEMQLEAAEPHSSGQSGLQVFFFFFLLCVACLLHLSCGKHLCSCALFISSLSALFCQTVSFFPFFFVFVSSSYIVCHSSFNCCATFSVAACLSLYNCENTSHDKPINIASIVILAFQPALGLMFFQFIYYFAFSLLFYYFAAFYLICLISVDSRCSYYFYCLFVAVIYNVIPMLLLLLRAV